MKKIVLFASAVLAQTALLGSMNAVQAQDAVPTIPKYVVVEKPQVNLANFSKDADGFYTIFNGKDFTGWRTYGRDEVTPRWVIDDGAIHFNSKGAGDGGDIMFAKRFGNFVLEVEWKLAKGGNSGIFYLTQEVESIRDDGSRQLEAVPFSAPEYQVLDNVNHPDAKLGKDGNRQSASLYDMIPAKPQNQKPYGQWNKARIEVNNGTVTHYQNGEKVLEYRLWTPQWTQMLINSKFHPGGWPLAFVLLNNCGGPDHEGYIAFQDHGDDVWFRNIRVKPLD